MKYDEYEAKLGGVVQNPDTAPTVVQDILNELKSDLGTLESMKADLEAKDTRIRDLQDTNVKLFMSQTGASEPEPEEDWTQMEGQMAIEAFIDAHKEE